jgi:hypothetical protein
VRALVLVMLIALVVRWSDALAGTRDKPPRWQAPRLHTWPLRLSRDGCGALA